MQQVGWDSRWEGNALNLTPDDIERRTFAIEDRGYNRDEVRKFLFEVAATVRLSLQTTRPPVPDSPPSVPGILIPGEASGVPADGPSTRSPTAPPHGLSDPGRDSFGQLGAEVAEVLRATHDAVAGRLEQAERDAAATGERAEADAAEIRREAEVDATVQHDRAKRVLITAQEQADTIIEEAEAQAAAVLVAAHDQAEQHAQQVASQARRHAELIVRAEGEALRRLHDAHAGVASAIETLTASEDRPVVDLTHVRPKVQMGGVAVDMAATVGDNAVSSLDPVMRMVRHAVDRAVTGAAEHADDDELPAGDGDHRADGRNGADGANGADSVDAETAAPRATGPTSGSGRTFDGTSDMTASV